MVGSDNFVYVGKKPMEKYVSMILMDFGIYEEVIVKARGQSISKAVDASLEARRAYGNRKGRHLEIGEITSDTDVLPNPDCERSNRVSSLEIHIHKKNTLF